MSGIATWFVAHRTVSGQFCDDDDDDDSDDSDGYGDYDDDDDDDKDVSVQTLSFHVCDHPSDLPPGARCFLTMIILIFSPDPDSIDPDDAHPDDPDSSGADPDMVLMVISSDL